MKMKIPVIVMLVLALCGFKNLGLPLFVSPHWTKVAAHLHTGIATPMHSMEEAHVFVNKFPYLSDPENYGVPDYWASPEQFFENGAGDCEDFAIAKYALGLENRLFAPREAMLVQAFDRERDNAVHMVLVVRGRVYDNQAEHSYAFDSAQAARYKFLGIVDTRRVRPAAGQGS
jgi:predicted transglutaminase-like cysteine proteinase